ncbi:MAG: hypothetical protein N3G75_09340 [Methanothrix sp.]|nr:hypothetical protein [Methanothrix sp.]MCX8208009.1 hypothetical protein [Methanothrix sp.]
MNQEITPAQIRSKGIRALVEALGPVGMARFLQQFDIGSGDYTEERERWLSGITLDDALREIKRRRERMDEENAQGARQI